MPRYKPCDRSPKFVPLVFAEQIEPGSFEYALDRLVDEELDFAPLDARYRNDVTGASAYDPRVMLKIVLLGYARGLVSSRAIAKACERNVQFMALSGDVAPSYTQIAQFVRELGSEIETFFGRILMVCDALGLIGREMFAIDGVKLPCNASKERSGTHAELEHRAERLEKATRVMLERHQARDGSGESKSKSETDALAERHARRIEALRREAAKMREFVAGRAKRENAKGEELKTNVTDPESAKMATSKGVIQGYAAQAAVDSRNQVIVAASVIGSGSEQQALVPLLEKTAGLRTDQTLITADAGYHSRANVEHLAKHAIPAMIADRDMRARDVRFREQAKYKLGEPLHDKRATQKAKQAKPALFHATDFRYDATKRTLVCPAGKSLYRSGNEIEDQGIVFNRFKGTVRDCVPCPLRGECLRTPERTRIRQVAINLNRARPLDAIERMRQAIDSPAGRALYAMRIGTVEPVFGNVRHNKGFRRFTLRGQMKVGTQWSLACLMHNIEKIAHGGYHERRRARR